MRQRYFLGLVAVIQVVFGWAQKPATVKETGDKPKLVVGIIIDQMRDDYIYRFWNRYGQGGFKRLVNNGYYFKNAHYNYVPTYTGPGHACVYTGSTPSRNGIIANEWYNRSSGKMMNCVEDKAVTPVGTDNERHRRSPANLLATTIGDELKISSNNRAKVFGVALKDRSAIFPAGHAANGAFWLDDKTGNFVSSSWYMKVLPQWLKAFNERNLILSYLSGGWNTLYPLVTYTSSINDTNRYERAHVKKDLPVFPYIYETQIKNKNYGTVAITPYGNTLTRELAVACLKGEQMGKDDECDLLAVSFSSPDIIGHSYGPRSVEIEDTYLRLDKELELLFNELDKEVGNGNYMAFLTADHGGADVPNHLLDNKIPAGVINEDSITKAIKQFAFNQFGDSALVVNVSNSQVFLDRGKIQRQKLSVDNIKQDLCNFLLNYKGVAEAYPSEVFKTSSFSGRDDKSLLQRGFNHLRSGDVLYVLQPAWMEYVETGTTHGSSYLYDTHVPLLFFGKGISKGNSFEYVTITQIAPTLSALLKLNYPNACIAEPLQSYFQK